MDKDQNVAHGLKWGLICSITYCVLLILRYKLGAGSLIAFSLVSSISYPVILILMLLCGIKRKKQLGGFIELKDAFQTMFVCLLIFELAYSIFNFIYIKFVDPDFFQNFKNASEELLLKSGQSQAQVDKTLSKIDVDAAKKMNGFDMAKSYLVFVGITGAIAFIFALIIKKKRDPFNNATDNFIQAP